MGGQASGDKIDMASGIIISASASKRTSETWRKIWRKVGRYQAKDNIGWAKLESETGGDKTASASGSESKTKWHRNKHRKRENRQHQSGISMAAKAKNIMISAIETKTWASTYHGGAQ